MAKCENCEYNHNNYCGLICADLEEVGNCRLHECSEWGECDFCNDNGFCKHLGYCADDCEFCTEYEDCDRPEKEVI